jgi:hypothetical protein
MHMGSMHSWTDPRTKGFATHPVLLSLENWEIAMLAIGLHQDMCCNPRKHEPANGSSHHAGRVRRAHNGDCEHTTQQLSFSLGDGLTAFCGSQIPIIETFRVLRDNLVSGFATFISAVMPTTGRTRQKARASGES